MEGTQLWLRLTIADIMKMVVLVNEFCICWLVCASHLRGLQSCEDATFVPFWTIRGWKISIRRPKIVIHRLVDTKIRTTFAVLLGVPPLSMVAEKIPSEPDMYNDSAGKR